MSRFQRLECLLGLVLLLLAQLGCTAIFGDFKIDDAAFDPGGVQTGIIVTPPKGLYTTEWGGQATFTIVLDRAPTSDVTVKLSSSNTNEGNVAPASVTFNQDDWKAPQVITVTGMDDGRPDGNQRYKIVTNPATSGDPFFNGRNALDVELLNIDNETAGITVVPTSGLVTSEVGGQDTFTVVLNSKPMSEVTIKAVSDTPTEGTVSPDTLVFTPVNWMAPQVVTVTGVDDADAPVKDPAHKYNIIVSCTSDDQNYARVATVSVAATNQDNESAGLMVNLMTGIDPIDPKKLRTSESGDSATFTVALSAPPSADVVVDVSSDTITEGVVSPDTLTFTQANWNAPQTVTVTGQDDPGGAVIADGDQPYKIKLNVRPGGEDAEYALVPETDILASNVDSEKPGFTLMLLTGIDPQDPTKLLTSEAGTTATFSLALNSQPSGTVTITVLSGNTLEGTVTPNPLTFTTDNWQSPQIVSVTGRNDEIADGSPVYYVTTTVATSEDPGYAPLDPPDVQVINQDDDSAGVRVVLAKGIDPNNQNKLVTDEYGTTATFTVALTSQPIDDVSIPLASSNAKEGAVSPATLTFTKLNYRAPQTVTITGLNDDDIDGNQPFAINVGPAQSSNDANYDLKFSSQVQVTNRDDDSAAVIVTPTSGLTTSESGKSDSFTVRLQTKPTDNVTIGVSSSNPNEGKPNTSSVVFTPVNWNANQTVIVTGQDDDGTADGNAAYKIILAPATSPGDPNYNGKPDPTDVAVTNLDNDSANIIVTPTSGLVTKEDGQTATFTIQLTSKPTAVSGKPFVKIQLSSSRSTEGSVSPATVNFDDVNWRASQTVTVTGIDDQVADGPQSYLINVLPAQSSDLNYNNRKASDVSVTNADNDSPGVQIQPIPSSTPTVTTEKTGGSATFTVALNSLPTSDVTFTVTSLDTTEGKVSPGTLKFTSSNGKTPQTVTVTGVDDELADGDQQYTVRLSNASSVDSGYDGKFTNDLPFVNQDDDRPGLDINPTSGLVTSENSPGTATFTVALLSQPTASVSVAVSSSNKLEGTVSPTMLTFTTDDWNDAQTVTITGAQDDVVDGTQSYQVILGNASSSDPSYSGLFGTQLDVQNLDDDELGFIVDAAAMLQTTEKAGPPASFNVKLKSKPLFPVSVGLTSSNTNEGLVAPNQLTFSTSDWNELHPVTVSGVDDKIVDGDVSYQIVFAPATSMDMNYSSKFPAPVTVTNVDDDKLGVIVAPTTCATTPGSSTTFTIRLNSQPSADVTIALHTDNMTAGSVSPESVTFSPLGLTSWNMTQTITVTGVSDGSMSMMVPYTIITDNASAPGETTGYDGFSSIDDVACINTTPP